MSNRALSTLAGNRPHPQAVRTIAAFILEYEHSQSFRIFKRLLSTNLLYQFAHVRVIHAFVPWFSHACKLNSMFVMIIWWLKPQARSRRAREYTSLEFLETKTHRTLRAHVHAFSTERGHKPLIEWNYKGWQLKNRKNMKLYRKNVQKFQFAVRMELLTDFQSFLTVGTLAHHTHVNVTPDRGWDP